ncbi:ABC transporter ATP-binding protein [Nocardioides litoris]|uniref:ABC transporter ATP-binding protein n=1 Tax=Nocardioides litoris TaxID=1926648 RepID=UPI00112351D7|nr:ABC transporter ATP-binding protein [Nocardioides litoris]
MSDSALTIEALQGWRGSAHVLQDLELELTSGVLAVIGRNGMGKTTLCEAITGVLRAPGSRVEGRINVHGRQVERLPAHRRSRLGIAYVPQGRRLFGSLTVEETLRVAQRRGEWTVARVCELFPRLSERLQTRGTSLSGGEQQMLAIGRALLTQPRLLVMDEPSEGLAPIVVDQVIAACHGLAEAGMDILVVEQNLAAATAMSDHVVVIANGRVAAHLSSQELVASGDLQRRYLGIGMDSAPDVAFPA